MLKLRRLAALPTLLFFCLNTVLAAPAESNVWKERQQRLAQLSPPTTPPSALLGNLPAARPIAALQPGAAVIATPTSRGTIGRLTSALPLTHVTIRDVHDAGLGHPAVVLIQDVHLNPEAQTNIAEALQRLDAGKAIEKIGVEGAFANLNFSRLDGFSDRKLVADVSADFMQAGLLAAPSFAGAALGPSRNARITGVDDRSAYDLNVVAYRSAVKLQPALTSALDKFDLRLTDIKRRIFSPELAALDGLSRQFKNGDVGLGVYLSRLSAVADRTPAAVREFLEAYEIEKRLDFDRVEAERRRVIEKLATAMTGDELRALLDSTVAYRTGAISLGAFHGRLKALCREKGIDLASAPSFNSYLRYVLLADGIHGEDLARDQAQLEAESYAKLITTEDQRSAVLWTGRAALLRRLESFALSPDEWDRFHAEPFTLAEFDRALDALGSKASPASLPVLTSFEDFYRLADQRSETIVNRLLEGNPSAAALVVGGFHTPRIARLLEKRGCSLVVCSPRLTRVNLASGTAYLTIFSREKTPIEKVFSGERLFINPAGVNFAADSSLIERQVVSEAAARVGEGESTGSLPPGVTSSRVGALVRVMIDGIAIFFGRARQAAGYLNAGARVGRPGAQFVPMPSAFRRWGATASIVALAVLSVGADGADLFLVLILIGFPVFTFWMVRSLRAMARGAAGATTSPAPAWINRFFRGAIGGVVAGFLASALTAPDLWPFILPASALLVAVWSAAFPKISKPNLAVVKPTIIAPTVTVIPSIDELAKTDYLVISPTYKEGDQLRSSIREMWNQGYLDRVLFINDGSADIDVLTALKADGFPDLPAAKNDAFRKALYFVSFDVNQRKEGAIRSTMEYLAGLYGEKNLPPVTLIQDSDSHLFGAGVRDLLQQGSRRVLDNDFAAMGVPIEGRVTRSSGVIAWAEAITWTLSDFGKRIHETLEAIFPVLNRVLRRSVPGGVAFFQTGKLRLALEKHSGRFEAGDLELANLIIEAEVAARGPSVRAVGPMFRSLRLSTDVMRTPSEVIGQKSRWMLAISDEDPAVFGAILIIASVSVVNLLGTIGWLPSLFVGVISLGTVGYARALNGRLAAMNRWLLVSTIVTAPISFFLVIYGFSFVGAIYLAGVTILAIGGRLLGSRIRVGPLSHMTWGLLPVYPVLASALYISSIYVGMAKGISNRIKSPANYSPSASSRGKTLTLPLWSWLFSRSWVLRLAGNPLAGAAEPVRRAWVEGVLSRLWARAVAVPILELALLPGITMALSPLFGTAAAVAVGALVFTLLHGLPSNREGTFRQGWGAFAARLAVSYLLLFGAFQPDLLIGALTHIGVSLPNSVSQVLVNNPIALVLGGHGVWNSFNGGAVRRERVAQTKLARDIVALLRSESTDAAYRGIISLFTAGTSPSLRLQQTLQGEAPLATFDAKALATSISLELAGAVARGDLSATRANVAAELLASLLSSSRNGAATPVVDESAIPEGSDGKAPLDVFRWLSPNRDTAVAEAETATARWRAQVRGVNDRLILMVPEGQRAAVEQRLAQRPGGMMGIRVLEAGRFGSLASLLDEVGGLDPAAISTRHLRFLVRNDSGLPPGFFDLAAAGLPEASAEALQRSLEIYLIVSEIAQAVRIDGALLPSFEALRTVMIQA